MNHLKNRLVDLLSVFKAREVVLLVSASSFNNSPMEFKRWMNMRSEYSGVHWPH
jgi:hypothetical protein